MAKIILPGRIFGKDIDGAMKRVLEGDNQQEPAQQQAPQANAPSLDGFIWVPSANVSFAEERSLNGLTWNKAIDEIYNKGIIIEELKAEMPTPFEFMSFLNYLLAGNIQGLPETKRKAILDDILKTGSYRGNHLNAMFVEDAKGFNSLGIQTATFDSSGKLVNKTAPLETCLAKNDYADINTINKQGLLTKMSANQNYEQGKNAYFWKPVNGYVAWFYAYSDRAYLYCGRNADDSDSSLGVRLVVRPKGSAKNSRRHL